MVLYLCVLIVFSLHRESLKLILATNNSPRWFCHISIFDVICVTLNDLLGYVALYHGTIRMSTIAYITLHDYHMTLVRIHIMHVHRT
jgi:hypothetical protein